MMKIYLWLVLEIFLRIRKQQHATLGSSILRFTKPTSIEQSLLLILKCLQPLPSEAHSILGGFQTIPVSSASSTSVLQLTAVASQQKNVSSPLKLLLLLF